MIRAPGQSLSTVMDAWLSDAVEPREHFAETWSQEVVPLLRRHLTENNITPPTAARLNEVVSTLGYIVRQRGDLRALVGTPTYMKFLNPDNILNDPARRGAYPCLCKVNATTGVLMRYGLRAPFRAQLFELLRESGSGYVVPEPVTEAEIESAINGTTVVPPRFLEISMAAGQ